jgi:hypothetical protein
VLRRRDAFDRLPVYAATVAAAASLLEADRLAPRAATRHLPHVDTAPPPGPVDAAERCSGLRRDGIVPIVPGDVQVGGVRAARRRATVA